MVGIVKWTPAFTGMSAFQRSHNYTRIFECGSGAFRSVEGRLALSPLGKRVTHDVIFISRRGSGEGVMPPG